MCWFDFEVSAIRAGPRRRFARFGLADETGK
jgi:hypothetical protein